MRKFLTPLINIHRRYPFLIPALVFLVTLLPFITHAQASLIQEGLQNAMSGIALAVSTLLGLIMQFVMWLFIAVAQYDGFATAPAIGLGWALIRDLCNMVIVVYLLYIAFQYALGFGNVKLDRQLPMLVLVAIGINFSKMITLMLVDISQVAMMTFVNSFKNIGVAELYRIMNVGDFFKNSRSAPAQKDFTGSLATIFFMVIIMLVVIAVIVLLMAILIVRIVYIWLHIILSPLMVLGYAVDWEAIKTVKDQWRSTMTNYLLIGPCLAFFIWLTFASFQTATRANGAAQIIPNEANLKQFQADAEGVKYLGELAAPEKLAGLFVAIAMLLGGLGICSKYTAGMPGGLDKKLKGIGDFGKRALTFSATRLPIDITTGVSRRLGAAGTALATRTEGTRLETLGGLVGRGVQLTGEGVGRGIRAGKGVGEFLRQPGTLAKGIYEQLIPGEAGAFQSAITSSRQAELKNARTETGKLNLNQAGLRAQMEQMLKGGLPDKTIPEKMALFELAAEKGVFKSPDEYLKNMKYVLDSGKESTVPGMVSLLSQWEGEQKKKRFGDKSIWAKPILKAKKDGSYDINTEEMLEESFEMFADLDDDNFWGVVNNRDIKTTEGLKHDKNGNLEANQSFTNDQFGSDILQNKIAAIMGMDETTLARTKGRRNKELLRQNISNLMQAASYKEKGADGKEVMKSKLTAAELNKLERLAAATLVDGGKYKKATDGEVAEEINRKQSDLGIDPALYQNIQARNPEEVLKHDSGKTFGAEEMELINKPHDLMLAGPKIERKKAAKAAAQAAAPAGEVIQDVQQAVAQAVAPDEDKEDRLAYLARQGKATNPKMIEAANATRRRDTLIRALAERISQNPSAALEDQATEVAFGDLGTELTQGDGQAQQTLINELKSLENEARTHVETKGAVEKQYEGINRALAELKKSIQGRAVEKSEVLTALKEIAQGIKTNAAAPKTTTNGLADAHGAVLDAVQKIQQQDLPDEQVIASLNELKNTTSQFKNI